MKRRVENIKLKKSRAESDLSSAEAACPVVVTAVLVCSEKEIDNQLLL